MRKLLILTVIILLLVVGCTIKESQINTKESLPLNATSIVFKGNGWITFEFEGNKFLYHKESQGGGYRGYEAITQIIEDKEKKGGV